MPSWEPTEATTPDAFAATDAATIASVWPDVPPLTYLPPEHALRCEPAPDAHADAEARKWESSHDPTGAVVWESSLVLWHYMADPASEYRALLAERAPDKKGGGAGAAKLRVCELGAGTGLLGLGLAKVRRSHHGNTNEHRSPVSCLVPRASCLVLRASYLTQPSHLPRRPHASSAGRGSLSPT